MRMFLTAICIAIMLLVGTVPSVLGNSISGIVYEDNDKNGVRETGENGLANISVQLGGPVMCLNENGLFVEPDEYGRNTTTNETGYYNFDVQGFGAYFINVSTTDMIIVRPAQISINHPNATAVDFNLTKV
jgi:hypothetical protein